MVVISDITETSACIFFLNFLYKKGTRGVCEPPPPSVPDASTFLQPNSSTATESWFLPVEAHYVFAQKELNPLEDVATYALVF